MTPSGPRVGNVEDCESFFLPIDWRNKDYCAHSRQPQYLFGNILTSGSGRTSYSTRWDSAHVVQIAWHGMAGRGMAHTYGMNFRPRLSTKAREREHYVFLLATVPYCTCTGYCIRTEYRSLPASLVSAMWPTLRIQHLALTVIGSVSGKTT